MEKVVCIHSVSLNEPCLPCGRMDSGDIDDCIARVAMEMIWERVKIKRSYEDAKILMKMTRLDSISELTGVPVKKLREMQKIIEGELCKPETSTQKNN